MNKIILIIEIFITMLLLSGCTSIEGISNEELRINNYVLSCRLGCTKYTNLLMNDSQECLNNIFLTEVSCTEFCEKEIRNILEG